MADPVRVSLVASRRDDREFVQLPYRLYRDDCQWVAPLRVGERRRWAPKHNASLRHIRVARFVARRQGRVVGRIAVSLDPRFRRWVADAGFFGFFETESDPSIGEALFQAAEDQLRQWGCTRSLGPVNQSTQEEVGLLTEGFDSPPALLTPYSPPWYRELFGSLGYETDREYLAFEWTPGTPPSPAVKRIGRSMDPARGSFGDYTFRTLDLGRFNEEVEQLGALYNATFRDVWGFVELDADEFRERAGSFRPFHNPELISFVSLRGRDVGFSVILPDVNQALKGLDGRLVPVGWLRLMRRVPRIRAGRFILMGVLPEALGRGLGPALALHLRARVLAAGLERVEVSLVQSSNDAMIRVIEALGCRRTKRFSLMEREL
jgi:GNAT superfamily N-acetyltransferase